MSITKNYFFATFILTLILTLILIIFSSQAQAQSAEISLTVEEPTGTDRIGWPVTSGIPLARNSLKNMESAALFTVDGRQIPLQTEALSLWPDGSIRWLLLDFQIDLKAGEKKNLLLRYGPDTKRSAVANPVRVEQDTSGVEINTGPLRLKLSDDKFKLFDAVWLDLDSDGAFSEAERITSYDGAGIVLKTPDGRSFWADKTTATITMEQKGPLRACVKIEGKHANKDGEMFRYIVRIHAYRGQPFLRFYYTFINDYQNALMAKIDSLDMVFSLDQKQGVTYALDGKNMPATGRLFQVDDQGYEINSKPAGEQAAGWAAMGTDKAGLAVGIREFWQNWPKGIEQKPGEIRLSICPQFPKGLYDGKPLEEEAKLYYYLRNGEYSFKIGVARTHELWATFFAASPNADGLSRFFQAAEKPLLAQCDPAYVSSTKAMGAFPPADSKKYFGYDAWANDTFELDQEQREQVREYGMLNHGDEYLSDYWNNLEYDMAHCLFIQYLRTGDRRMFHRAEQAARHQIDVDVVHAVNRYLYPYFREYSLDERHNTPGEIWSHSVAHTGGYYDGRASLKMPDIYQHGMLQNNGHVWIAGALDYYLLTGDRLAMDVSVLVSDTMARQCPTLYSDHLRGVGWPLNLVLSAYEATGDKKYLDAATRQWQTLKKNLDPEKGWVVVLAYGHCDTQDLKGRCSGQNSYMLALTLSGLARYHRITGDPEVLKGLSAGIDQLIREMWVEEAKTFKLTSCFCSGRNTGAVKLCSVTFLSAEAFAYESALTGNKEHLRIFRDAFHTAVDAGAARSRARAKKLQLNDPVHYSGFFHFTPFGLSALED